MNLRQPRALWFSLVASNVLFAAIACFVLQRPPMTSIDVGALIPAGEGPAPTLWAVGFVILVLSGVFPRVLVRRTTQTLTPAQIVVRATTPLILSLALAEACTLCGFVSAHFMGAHVPERVLLPTLAALVAAARMFPTEARLRALAGIG